MSIEKIETGVVDFMVIIQSLDWYKSKIVNHNSKIILTFH